MADEVEDSENSRLVGVFAVLLTLGALYVWFRVWGKAAEKAVPPLMRASSDAIRKVIARAEQIAKEAAAAEGGSS